MPTLILLMIFGAAAFSYWNAARAAAEHAERLGRNACSAADVILLDQTVQASGIRVRRNEDGRLGFERSFRFESVSYTHLDVYKRQFWNCEVSAPSSVQ